MQHRPRAPPDRHRGPPTIPSAASIPCARCAGAVERPLLADGNPRVPCARRGHAFRAMCFGRCADRGAGHLRDAFGRGRHAVVCPFRSGPSLFSLPPSLRPFVPPSRLLPCPPATRWHTNACTVGRSLHSRLSSPPSPPEPHTLRTLLHTPQSRRPVSPSSALAPMRGTAHGVTHSTRCTHHPSPARCLQTPQPALWFVLAMEPFSSIFLCTSPAWFLGGDGRT